MYREQKDMSIQHWSNTIEIKLKLIIFVQAMYREQKDMSLGLGNTNGEEWWVCALHFSVQLGHFLISIKLFFLLMVSIQR